MYSLVIDIAVYIRKCYTRTVDGRFWTCSHHLSFV